MWTNIQPCKRTSQKSLNSFPSITPKFSTFSTKCVSGTSFSSQKQREMRGVLPTMWMKEIIRAVPGCFIGRRQPRILENIAELSLCFQGGGEEGDRLFELGVNAVKMVAPAYLHPGSAQGDYMQRFYVTHLTASSHGGFEGSPSLAGLGLHLTQLWVYKDNGCQTSRPLTNKKREGDNQSAPVSFYQTWVKSRQLIKNDIYMTTGEPQVDLNGYKWNVKST